MENPVNETTHRPVGFGGALTRQLGLLWASRRPLLLGVALLAVLVLAGEPWSDSALARLLAPWPVWLVAVGPIWAFAVFHNEGPSHRLYLWSAPVDRFQQTLARLVAGIVWLWALFGLLILTGVVMAAFDGNISQLGEVGVAGWVNMFTGPLLGYLCISFLTVASDYPIRWFFGILFVGPFVMSILDEWLGLESVVETLSQPLIAEQWGLFQVITGELGESALQVAARIQGADRAAPIYDVTYWWPATALWILAGVAVVGFLASRHPDTLPRLRRRS
jgi:hypothetical protein